MEAEPNLTGPDQAAWYARLVLEQDNIREALEHACEIGDGERALMLSGTIWRFWWNRGQISEATRWYERAFLVGGDASPTARARGVFGAAHMAESRGLTDDARTQFEEAVDLFRLTDDTRWLILALTHLAIAFGLEGDGEKGVQPNTEALELARATNDLRGEAVVLSNMSFLVEISGDKVRAAELVAQSLEMFRAAGDIYGVAGSLQEVAMIALRAGRLDEAAVSLRESLQLSVSIGDAQTLAHSLSTSSRLALERGRADISARLSAATEALCGAHGFKLAPTARQSLSETIEAAHAVLGDRFETEWAAGESLDLDAAVELALAAID